MWFFCSINAIVFKNPLSFKPNVVQQGICVSSSYSLCIPMFLSCFVWGGSAPHPAPIKPLSLPRLDKVLDPCSRVQNQLQWPTASSWYHPKLLTLVTAEEWAPYVNSHAVLSFHIKCKNGHFSCGRHDISATERNLPSECHATNTYFRYCILAWHLYYRSTLGNVKIEHLSFEASWDQTVAAVSHGDLSGVTNHIS